MAKRFQNIVIDQSSDDYNDKMQRLRNEHSMSDYIKTHEEIVNRVRGVVKDISENGDAALANYTEKFDGVKLTPKEFRVTNEDMAKAHADLDPKLLGSIRKAIENVKKYQSDIFIGDKNTNPGIRYNALKRVCLCIPGASAPLPSSVIMTAVPAMVAGVKEIVAVSAPRYNGNIHPTILATCYELGIKEVYRVSGAQAVAAMAWGTETIEKVDKIVGPGGDYVQLAIREVFGLIDTVSFAGPSDVLIVADETANPAWVAADILSQAEHNPGAGLLVTANRELVENVLDHLDTQVDQLDRAQGTADCLAKYSAIILLNSFEEVIDFANDFAAEHLQVQCGTRSREVAAKIDNAGAIFIGDYTPVAVGDYWAGPSHTLPTRQTTKYFSAVTSNDFIKSSSIIE
jgi:histidinol dehydrogenase